MDSTTADTASNETSVTLVRTFKAPPHRVFAAWTDATLIERWMAPDEYAVRTVTADARVGGRYRIAVQGPKGDTHVTTGEYLEIVPNRRIVKTWIYEGPNAPDGPMATRVSVEFDEPAPGITRLTLTHERVADAKIQEGLRRGWTSLFAKLETLLGHE